MLIPGAAPRRLATEAVKVVTAATTATTSALVMDMMVATVVVVAVVVDAVVACLAAVDTHVEVGLVTMVVSPALYSTTTTVPLMRTTVKRSLKMRYSRSTHLVLILTSMRQLRYNSRQTTPSRQNHSPP
ncbi:hypothetical protein DQ04_07921030 [Trypanosoma grayi]|uniref:hypothetical protein n=1 Tax=Trypanosoma grayi TaxID=71804 RepID=UPI0004F4B57C|nr:hypothetical protein DQ04_07921030 [Trypanosoma grayi]KEG08140.1 hypothetical protein DQ04_07921030 [Trypanosoma grayi]